MVLSVRPVCWWSMWTTNSPVNTCRPCSKTMIPTSSSKTVLLNYHCGIQLVRYVIRFASLCTIIDIVVCVCTCVCDMCDGWVCVVSKIASSSRSRSCRCVNMWRRQLTSKAFCRSTQELLLHMSVSSSFGWCCRRAAEEKSESTQVENVARSWHDIPIIHTSIPCHTHKRHIQ